MTGLEYRDCEGANPGFGAVLIVTSDSVPCSDDPVGVKAHDQASLSRARHIFRFSRTLLIRIASIMPNIAVAISGGGHRAALFGLGVLLYLVDSKKNADVVSIASVSGGSLTNGYVGLSCDFRTATSSDFERCMKPFAIRVGRDGTLWAWWGTWVYLAVTLVVFLTCWLVWLIHLPAFYRFLLFIVAAALWSKLFLQQRGRVCDAAFNSLLFSTNRPVTLLSDLCTQSIAHVICATDLHAGEHIYFSGGFIYSYRLGLGVPGGLALSSAVQASAAYPGGFPPSWLKTKGHSFSGGAENTLPSHMVLLDGGIYDNMADQWVVGLPARRNRLKECKDCFATADEMIVVNGSSNVLWSSSVDSLKLPILGELYSLLRTVNILFDNTTTTRRQSLFAMFDEALRKGNGIKGALVTIEQSPIRVPMMLENDKDPHVAARAKSALNALRMSATDDQWRDLVSRNLRVPTTFRALGPGSSADLMLQGYIVAMANLHTILDYPLLQVPPRDRVEQLLA